MLRKRALARGDTLRVEVRRRRTQDSPRNGGNVKALARNTAYVVPVNLWRLNRVRHVMAEAGFSPWRVPRRFTAEIAHNQALTQPVARIRLLASAALRALLGVEEG